jgi:hypothetical protein
MKQYTKSDLLKLKDSKPVPIIAHSHELVVPVVYADMAKKFLEKKGITLPLTHKELNTMKKEAQSLAKGGNVKDIKNIKNVKGQQQVATQKVIINLGKTKRRKVIRKKKVKDESSFTPFTPPNTPNPPNALNKMYPTNYFNQPIRPNNFAMIRPYSANTAFFQPDKPKDKDKEIEEYKKELEKRANQIKELEKNEQRIRESQQPIRKDENQKSLEEEKKDIIKSKLKEGLQRIKNERERLSTPSKAEREIDKELQRTPPQLEREIERLRRNTLDVLQLPPPIRSDDEKYPDSSSGEEDRFPFRNEAGHPMSVSERYFKKKKYKKGGFIF